MRHNGKKIRIKHVDFPIDLQGIFGGFAIVDKEEYFIGIDSSRAGIVQRYVLGHELAHVFLNHHEQHDKPIAEQEAEARKEAWNYYRAYRDNRL